MPLEKIYLDYQITFLATGGGGDLDLDIAAALVWARVPVLVSLDCMF